jgi:hypothetical protein
MIASCDFVPENYRTNAIKTDLVTEYFGDVALIAHCPSSFSVVSMTDVIVVTPRGKAGHFLTWKNL